MKFKIKIKTSKSMSFINRAGVQLYRKEIGIGTKKEQTYKEEVSCGSEGITSRV